MVPVRRRVSFPQKLPEPRVGSIHSPKLKNLTISGHSDGTHRTIQYAKKTKADFIEMDVRTETHTLEVVQNRDGVILSGTIVA